MGGSLTRNEDQITYAHRVRIVRRGMNCCWADDDQFHLNTPPFLVSGFEPFQRNESTSTSKSNDKRSVSQKLLTICRHDAAVADVADQIPVDCGAVSAAAVWVARTDRHVHRAADLFVEQDVAGEASDIHIRAEGELAKEPRARIGVERL